jgi:DNA-binding NarL/FixJ family response regulator
MIRILIADDHRLFRQGLRQLCEVSGGFQVVAEAETGREALALAWEHQPDVILMDIRMPGMDGVEACRQIVAHQPQTPIIMLTMYRQDRHLTDALAAGACGYLLKNCDEATLFAAIRAAVRGEAPVDPAMLGPLLQRLKASEGSEQLTEGERVVLVRVAKGDDNKQIAEVLNITTGTVSNRLRAIYDKLRVTNRTEAALYALRMGWATLDDE